MNVTIFDTETIKSICKKHHVKSLYIFGSVIIKGLDKANDVDLLVEFNIKQIPDYFSNYMSLLKKLQEFFNKKVDLIEQQAIKNPILIQSINQSKDLLYAA